MFNGAQNDGEAVMEKTMCVCMHACVQSHVNDMAPLRRWDMAGEATAQKQLFLAAITASMETLGSWGSAGNRHAGISAWVWGSRRRKCPCSWATQLLSTEAQRGIGARCTSSNWLYQAGPGFPPHQSQGLRRTKDCRSVAAPGKSWLVCRKGGGKLAGEALP